MPPVEEEGDDDHTPNVHRRGPRPLPFVEPVVVEYVCRRFPARVAKARELTRTPPPYGVAYRDVLRLRCIGGALADLGLSTGKGEQGSIVVDIDGHDVPIHYDDVMVTLGMRPSTYKSVRSRLEKVQAVYTWLGQNKHVWETELQRGTVPSTEHRAYRAMNALFGPTPLPSRRHIPPEPLPAGIHDALWEPCRTFLRWADEIISTYELKKCNSLPVSPEFYDGTD